MSPADETAALKRHRPVAAALQPRRLYRGRRFRWQKHHTAVSLLKCAICLVKYLSRSISHASVGAHSCPSSHQCAPVHMNCASSASIRGEGYTQTAFVWLRYPPQAEWPSVYRVECGRVCKYVCDTPLRVSAELTPGINVCSQGGSGTADCIRRKGRFRKGELNL